MPIGKIIGLPPAGSDYARVRDEYMNEYTVRKQEIPEDAEIGDSYAYKVDVFYYPESLATTLKKDDD